MRDQKNTILGLSIGTQTIGVVVVKKGKLIDWQVKNYSGKWSKNKLRIIVLYLERYIENNNITSLAIKTPEPCRSSDGITELITAITALAKSKQIKVEFYPISSLKTHCNVENKKDMMKCVLNKYPELIYTFQKAERTKKVYYVKIFEAVLVTML